MMKKGMIGLLLATISLPLFAQKIAVKTNLIYDITTTFNLELSTAWLPVGPSMYPAIIIPLLFPTIRSGSTGWCSPKPAIGSPKPSTAIS